MSGSYALYAGLRSDVMTYAFEPSPSNYLALCRNIYENGSETNIRAYCIALDDGVSVLRRSTWTI